MSIKCLDLENYKAFARRAEFKIRPITLFYGYNSAGKSAALRFLKILADSTDGTSFAPINLGSDAIRGSNFQSILSKYNSSQRLEFGLAFEHFEVNFTVFEVREKNSQIIQRLEINAFENSKSIVLDWNPYGLPLENALSSYAFFDDQEKIFDEEITFDGLVPLKYSERLAPFLAPLAHELRKFSRNFVSLAPDCTVPGRFHTETTPARKISYRGDGVVSRLQSADDDVIADISNWYQKATGYLFVRSEITIGNQSGHRFTLHPNADLNIDVDIIDTGEGMGQVLPVVSLLTLAQHNVLGSNPVISLEHPELHIHPDAHAHLADLFCRVISENENCSILVETHSENLLLGLQLAVARGEVSPNDIAIHWVRGTEMGAVVEVIELDEGARPIKDNWPIDVYRKNSKIAREIFETRKKIER
ncbi:AAA family ATPase [Salipiger sp. PrR002]|uniref:AAA family ATPase n=1 Tax=Salipiger sp. PrR002 TaxID=2706489 RepID=UPI0013B7F01C|nr:AAA family ATPase [Salipiger sp. PrR002]NDW01219.1 AAA family ATPase [Salipiger sp. PrR002]NDW59787.1 AAA family ATPase [Salipiger sp. PrR004]